MNDKEMRALLLEIQKTNDLPKNVTLMKEVLLHSDFCNCEKYNFLLQYECGKNGEQWCEEKNDLKKFLEYKKMNETTFYGDVDCDVSMAAVVAYGLLYPELKTAILGTKYKKLQYEYKLDGVRYGGDTLTSALTVLKRYLDYAGIQENNYKTWGKDVECKMDEIWDLMDESARRFLKIYMTLGNYICMPCKGYQTSLGKWTSVNGGRSNYGKWDTVDRFLWKMYQYFFTKNSDILLELFTDCKEELRDEVLVWNEQFKIQTWSDFVEVHAFEDLVEVIDCKNKIYGRPIGLKTGMKIDVFVDEEYNPMPENEKECKIFFETATRLIEKRGQRMIRKMYELEIMATYDLKNVHPYYAEKLDGKGLVELLHNIKGKRLGTYAKLC
ncbi:MAG: hypothetical protein R3Y54_14025 [Eubacteriales bacterium]